MLERCGSLPVEVVGPAAASGLVLARDVVASEPLPPFANTAMDGFALRAADTVGAGDDRPRLLRVVDTVTAGRTTERVVGPGEAVRIMTGAPMPDGADAVVPVERTRVGAPSPDGSDLVDVLEEVEPGRHVRRAGDDVRPGDAVLEAGEVVGPAAVGMLAGLGVATVAVVRRPVVGVLSTGDELVTGPGALPPGSIRDSNRPTLVAQLALRGATPVDLGCVPDDDEAIEAALRDGVDRCDAVLSSGGVSMGDVDLVKVVLDRIGEMRWMQIAIRPAKPFAFGTVGAADGRPVPVFGLPGNPVSSLVSFELLARPAMRRMAGHRPGAWVPPTVAAVAGEDLRRRPDGKTHFVRVLLEHGPTSLVARSAGGQGSHQLAALARSDGLAVLPDGDGVGAGDPVAVVPLR